MLLRTAFILAAIGASALNGAPASPLFDPVLFLLRPALSPLTVGADALFHFTSGFIAVATLMLAGIPAAAYERFRGHPDSTAASMAIWLVAAVLLSLPGILAIAGFFEID